MLQCIPENINLQNSKRKKKVSCSSADLKIVANHSIQKLVQARKKKIKLKQSSRRKFKSLNQREVNCDSLEPDKAEKLELNEEPKLYANKTVKRTPISTDVYVNNFDFHELKDCVYKKALNGHAELLNDVMSLTKGNKCEEVADSCGEQIIVSNDVLSDNFVIEDSFVRNNTDTGIKSMNVPQEVTTLGIKVQDLLRNKDHLEKVIYFLFFTCRINVLLQFFLIFYYCLLPERKLSLKKK